MIRRIGCYRDVCPIGIYDDIYIFHTSSYFLQSTPVTNRENNHPHLKTQLHSRPRNIRERNHEQEVSDRSLLWELQIAAPYFRMLLQPGSNCRLLSEHLSLIKILCRSRTVPEIFYRKGDHMIESVASEVGR